MSQIYSRLCDLERTSLNVPTPLVPRFETCALQGCLIEVDVDGATRRVHDFCSRTHANMAGARGGSSRDDCLGGAVCKIEDCIALVYRDPATGVVGTFVVQQATIERERIVFAPGCAKV